MSATLNAFIDSLTFLHPSLLALLAALPVLWFLLKVTPPSPYMLKFPATRFLEGLIPEKRTPSKTPWWILLLRIITAAAIIVAMAHPVRNLSGTIEGGGAIRVVIDNGWEAAQTWEDQISAAREILKQAGREDREVYLVTTSSPHINEGPADAQSALSVLEELEPYPWPSDYASAKENLSEKKIKGGVSSFWFGTGITGESFNKFAGFLQSQGSLVYFRPEDERLPVLLKSFTGSAQKQGNGAIVNTSLRYKGLPVTLRALSRRGRVIDVKTVYTSETTRNNEISFDLPAELQGNVAGIDIEGRRSAGTRLWLDNSGNDRTAGIYAPANSENKAPLAGDSYYLSRALEPYAKVITGEIPDLLKENPSMIILPDAGTLPPELLGELENWVKKGGLLIRFAGPKMAENTSGTFLVPVLLRAGERSLGGTLTWDDTKSFAPFPENSPFSDIENKEKITVNRQILAEPSSDLAEKTWASLEDGTPLITASPMEHGMLVLIHTTASPQWSDFAISGLFVRIMKRLAEISGNPTAATNLKGVMQPLSVSDGYGNLIDPPVSVKPINSSELKNLKIGPDHPPGIYGRSGYRVIINMGDHLKDFSAVSILPQGVIDSRYNEAQTEEDLRPALLLIASFLLIIDWVAMLMLSSGIFSAFLHRSYPKNLGLLALVAVSIVFPPATTAMAATQDNDAKYASDIYLAYVESGNSDLDNMSRKGLDNLASQLYKRTSVEPEGVVGINPEEDNFLFFPVIYWPVDQASRPLSGKASANVQSYLDHGGTILFDTRDASLSSPSGVVSGNTSKLRQIMATIDVPPLSTIPEGHVLGRSYYLLSTFPGRVDNGNLWIEEENPAKHDGVSSVIIGANDWAGAWSSYSGSNSDRQSELSIRFGINVVMYALCGNYKADQVHVPFILERLGK